MGSFPAVEKVIWDVFTSKINNQFQETFLQRIAGNVSFCVSIRISCSSTFGPGF